MDQIGGVNDSELADKLLTGVARIRRVLDERLKQHGVSVSRKRLLGALTQGPMRQGALAETFGVTPRTVTELVDGLVSDGYVERRMDPHDRRARLVHLTPAGSAANAAAMVTREQTLAEVFMDLSDQQRTEFAHVLDILGDRLAGMSASSDDQRAQTVSIEALTLTED